MFWQVTDSYDTQTCQSCGTKLSEYFCPKCKHFTGVEKKPYHCDKCGICRIHKDRSFHCEVCNVCLDKRLQGKHKCRPDSGHDQCCICLEVKRRDTACKILQRTKQLHFCCLFSFSTLTRCTLSVYLCFSSHVFVTAGRARNALVWKLSQERHFTTVNCC